MNIGDLSHPPALAQSDSPLDLTAGHHGKFQRGSRSRPWDEAESLLRRHPERIFERAHIDGDPDRPIHRQVRKTEVSPAVRRSPEHALLRREPHSRQRFVPRAEMSIQIAVQKHPCRGGALLRGPLGAHLPSPRQRLATQAVGKSQADRQAMAAEAPLSSGAETAALASLMDEVEPHEDVIESPAHSRQEPRREGRQGCAVKSEAEPPLPAEVPLVGERCVAHAGLRLEAIAELTAQ